jgi:hypothetical protein
MNCKKQVLIISILIMTTLTNTLVSMEKEIQQEKQIFKNAVKSGDKNKAEEMLNQYPHLVLKDINYDPLVDTLQKRKYQIASMLVEKGAEISQAAIETINENIRLSNLFIEKSEKRAAHHVPGLKKTLSEEENLRSNLLDEMQKRQKQSEIQRHQPGLERIIERQQIHPAEGSYEYLKSLGREKKL